MDSHYCWRADRHLTPCCEDAMVLQIPDYRQESDHDCAAACVATVLVYLGLLSHSKDVVKRIRRDLICDSMDGTDPRTIEAYLRRSGCNVMSGTCDILFLRQQCNQGRPVIAAVRNHWVVVAGVSGRKVHYQDPTSGAEKVSVDEFGAMWSDVDRMGNLYERFGISVTT